MGGFVPQIYKQGHHFLYCSGISPGIRKIALKLKLKKVIEQLEDQYVIKTVSKFRNYSVSFREGQEFEEFTKGLDNRQVKVRKGAWLITCNHCDWFADHVMSFTFYLGC